MKNSKPEEKTFGLKEIELRMIQVMQGQAMEAMGNFLTFIATERLAYKVTANTQYKVEDGKLVVWENEPEQPAEQPTGNEAPKDPSPKGTEVAVGSDNTAEALK